VNAPTREDFDRALRYAQENIRLGDEAADQAERHDRYQQAEQALLNAGRIMGAIRASIAPPLDPGAWGLPLAYGGAPPARGVLAGPGPREGRPGRQSRRGSGWPSC
jgi:hypothetical protein